ncbi:hypothetical protein DRI50_02845 [candidate division KSB1 bacterium]|nr:MAG: hypothetical protein DRI50_02845 [candidate division KSB1 bacterium]
MLKYVSANFVFKFLINCPHMPFAEKLFLLLAFNGQSLVYYNRTLQLKNFLVPKKQVIFICR